MNDENGTNLTDRQLLERMLDKIVSLENRVKATEQNQSAHFTDFHKRLVELEVQAEKQTSLAYQSLAIAHAVKAAVLALGFKPSLERDRCELQKQMRNAA